MRDNNELKTAVQSCGDGGTVELARNFGGKAVSVRIGVGEHDRLGVAVDELEVAVTSGGGESGDAESVAREICDRVQYLEERLGVQEVDRSANRTLVRSQTVTDRGGEGRDYYEGVVGCGEAGSSVSLKRFRVRQGEAGRERIPAVVTYEILERCVSDIGRVLAGADPA